MTRTTPAPLGFLAVGGALVALVLLVVRTAALRKDAGEIPDPKDRSEVLRPLAPILGSIEALRNPPRLMLGAYDGGLPKTFDGLSRLEAALDVRFSLISVYTAWGDRAEQRFPARLVGTIDRMGSVPMITWEPWVVDFDAARHAALPARGEREYACLAAIARGDYDFYVAAWAEAAAAWRKPLLLRFAHGMNDPSRYPWGPQNGNRPEDFVAAWKHVHRLFREAHADNVLWVWSPHASMPWFEYYYPGTDEVDWVALAVMNYGNIAPWSRWWTFGQILEKPYPALVKLGKPLMIAELGTLRSGGDAVEWYRDAFDELDRSYGRVRSLVLFNQESDTTMSASPLNWSVLQDARLKGLVGKSLGREFRR